MPIPVNLSFLTNAQLLPLSPNAQPIQLCSAPKEGMKAVPIQIPLGNAGLPTSWLIDLTAGSPNPCISQIAAIFIQNNLIVPCTVYFPDSGFQLDLQAGDKGLFPVICQAPPGRPPKFYVIFNESGVSTTDFINLIVLNQFIPEFYIPAIINVNEFAALPHGITTSLNNAFFKKIGYFRPASRLAVDFSALPVTLSSSGLVNSIHGCQIWADITSSSANQDYLLTISGLTSLQIYMNIPLQGQTTRSGKIKIFDQTDLDIIMQNGLTIVAPEALTFAINNTTNMTQGKFDITIQAG